MYVNVLYTHILLVLAFSKCLQTECFFFLPYCNLYCKPQFKGQFTLPLEAKTSTLEISIRDQETISEILRSLH